MRKYILNIIFDSADLSTIYKARQRIVLSKQNHSGTKLTWLAFRPFQNNSLEWNDDYAVYCSNADISSGIKIRRLSDIDAQPGVQYVFKNGFFSTAETSDLFVNEQSYHIRNEMEGFSCLAFGLAQGVVVNGRNHQNNPINAITVPYMQSISLMPHEVVELYLEAEIDSSVVVNNLRNSPFTISFGQEIGAVSVRYSSEKGMFFMV